MLLKACKLLNKFIASVVMNSGVLLNKLSAFTTAKKC